MGNFVVPNKDKNFYFNNQIFIYYMDNHVQHFYNTGKLLDGTYYFDPPLIEPEIKVLYNILRKVRHSKTILLPLKRPNSKQKNLLYIDVKDNTINNWQNIDTVKDEEGEYVLDNLQNIQRWNANYYGGSRVRQYRDGRLFVGLELLDTEDIFNQINESDEFDWVPKFTNPNTLVDTNLVDFLNQYFKDGGYNYQSEYEEIYPGFAYYRIDDYTGTYETIRDDKTFSLDSLKKALLNSITRMKSRSERGEVNYETIQEYQELYQALEPLFKMT